MSSLKFTDGIISTRKNTMLRIWVVLSIVAHVVLFSVGSLIAAQRDRKPLLVEKQFQVNLRKETPISTQSSAQSVAAVQPAPLSRELAASRPVLPAPVRQGTKRQVVQPAEQPPLLRTADQDTKKAPTPLATVPAHSPAVHDALLNARQLPTPVPMLKPKPVATPARPPRPKPTPLPPSATAASIVRPTPLLSAATPSAPGPSASPATEGSSAPKIRNPKSPSTVTNTSESTAERAGPQSAEEASETPVLPEKVLVQYAQGIAARIQTALKYPTQARRKGWEGTVTLKLYLRATGQVERAEVLEQTPYQALNEAALQALKKAQPFPPLDSAPAGQRIVVTIPIEFHLRR